MKTLELWVVRHGQTEENIKRILNGQGEGVITDLGIRQAQELGKRLSTEKFQQAYVSDLKRTRLTYDHIAQFNDHTPNVKYLPLLREKCHGVLNYLSIELPQKLAAEQNIHMRFFKPEGGESYVDVYERAQKFLQLVIDENFVEQEGQMQKVTDNMKVIAVTHRGFIMELMNVVNYLNDQTEPIYKEISGNCSITILKISQENESTNLQNMKIEIICQNDSSHCNKLN